jgi:hypothetical protein
MPADRQDPVLCVHENGPGPAAGRCHHVHARYSAASWPAGNPACTCASISPGRSTRCPPSSTCAPAEHRSDAALTRPTTPSSTKTAAPSRTGPPVPSNRRTPVSHSRPAAGAGPRSAPETGAARQLPPVSTGRGWQSDAGPLPFTLTRGADAGVTGGIAASRSRHRSPACTGQAGRPRGRPAGSR